MTTANRSRPSRWIGYVLAAALVLAIAAARVVVAPHRPAEAVAGLAIGAPLLAVFVGRFWRRAKPTLPAWTLALPCLAAIALTYGHVFEFENIFRWLGGRGPGLGLRPR
jgi:hypothetical protein